MDLQQLITFLNSQKVTELNLQSPEIDVLLSELYSEVLVMKRQEQWRYLLSFVVSQENAPRRGHGCGTKTRVMNFVEKVFLNSGIDLMPEYLEAIEESKKSSVIHFPFRPRIVK